MRTLRALVLSSGLLASAFAQERAANGRLWRWSAVAVMAATAADAHSSWGRYERNPLLRGADGRFGPRAFAMKFAVAGGGILAQWLLLSERPRAAGPVAAANFGVAGMLGGFAMHNHRLGARPKPAAPPPYLLPRTE